MRTRIIVIAAAVMLVIFGALVGLALASYAGTASAKDPDPPTGMHEACENMDHEGMSQGMGGMHEAMNADGEKGESMQSGMPEMH
jgi:hypothetical protein